jgi:hypothetical protein
MATVGGDDIDLGAGTKIPIYAFLQNGWKLKPQESNHTLNVIDGILLVDGGGDPFINTTGSFVVRVNYQQPVQAISFSTSGGPALTPTLIQMLEDFLAIEGHKPGVISENSPTLRKAGAVELAITGYGTNYTTIEKL